MTTSTLTPPPPPTTAPNSSSKATRDLSALPAVGAALASIVLAYVPVLSFAVYPFKMFGTLTHEWAHAVMTLLTGGHVVALLVRGDLSGETITTGGLRPLVLSAGYVGVVALGSLLLLVPGRYARRLLLAIGVIAALLPLAGTLLLGTSLSFPTWVWTLIFAAIVLLVWRFGGGNVHRFFARFLAFELCLAGIDGLRALVWLTWNAPSVATDATIAGHETFFPAPVWTILWALIDLVIFGLTARFLLRRALPRTPRPVANTTSAR